MLRKELGKLNILFNLPVGTSKRPDVNFCPHPLGRGMMLPRPAALATGLEAVGMSSKIPHKLFLFPPRVTLALTVQTHDRKHLGKHSVNISICHEESCHYVLSVVCGNSNREVQVKCFQP